VARALNWLGRDRERFREVVEQEFKDMPGTTMQHACTSAIQYKPADVRRDIDNLKAALAGANVAEGFLTAVAPASAVFNGVNEFYGSEREYIFALAEALRQEYLEVYEAGLVVQVDDAVLANMYDHLVQQSPQHYRKWAELRVEALNHALRGIPEDRVRYHVCFGSWHLPHMSDAPLEDIVDLILLVRAGAYSLEAANPRHEHEWRVWQNAKLPAGKILIPGVITHHLVTVEHPQVVADRIVRFAKIVGRENVIAGSDCGFAQAEHVQRVHPTVMWAKFESLAAGARLATANCGARLEIVAAPQIRPVVAGAGPERLPGRSIIRRAKSGPQRPKAAGGFDVIQARVRVLHFLMSGSAQAGVAAKAARSCRARFRRPATGPASMASWISISTLSCTKTQRNCRGRPTRVSPRTTSSCPLAMACGAPSVGSATTS
jgi:5-methyltetrahydropteroyltriglutamate--homocysteine methyltransferase